MQREMLHFVQHDKLSPYNHRLGVINARSERPVAVSSWDQICEIRYVEDNVRKRPFSTCLAPPAH